jgi:hypothetical protein
LTGVYREAILSSWTDGMDPDARRGDETMTTTTKTPKTPDTANVETPVVDWSAVEREDRGDYSQPGDVVRRCPHGLSSGGGRCTGACTRTTPYDD